MSDEEEAHQSDGGESGENQQNSEIDENDGEAGGDPASIASKTKLFVGNLAMTVDDYALRLAFDPIGELVECSVVVDQTTLHSKGYAFVKYRNAADCEKAIQQLNGTELHGKKLVVEYPKRVSRGNWAARREADKRAWLARQFEGPAPPINYREEPSDKANNVPFYELCNVLDAIASAQGFKAKLHLLFEGSKLEQHLKGGSWYPIMRLVLPDYDRERARYNLKETSIGKLFVFALGFRGTKNQHEDAIRLLHWKDPGIMQQYHGTSLGDFSMVLREVMVKRGHEKTSKHMTVGEVNALLDQLHLCGTEEDRLPIFKKFVEHFNAAEMFWITRIILKDMKCGLRADSVLRRYHRDAVEAMTATGDLRRVLAELNDPTVRRAFGVELFVPFGPMLAKILPMDTCTDKLGDFVIEEKMDGDRMLIHMDKSVNPPKIKLFTRNLRDYTDIYGNPEMFSYITQAFDCNQLIADGEMLSWDDENKQVMEFGKTPTVANEMASKDYTRKRWLYFVCFDVLFVDGERITGKPLRWRRKKLQDIIRPIHRRIEMIDAHIVTELDPDRRHYIVMGELDRIQFTKGEGLILKSLHSEYIAGEPGRKSGNWVKVKPELVNGLQEELDCLVLGGYYAESGGRASMDERDFATLLVGVPGGHIQAPISITDSASSGIPSSSMSTVSSSTTTASKRKERPIEFFTLAKIANGIPRSMREQICNMLRSHVVRTNSGQRPPHFVMPRRKEDIPDIWVPPEKSVVVQVTGSELVSCEWFSSNYTLRFPRVSRLRLDKSYLECTPFKEVERFARDFHGGTGLHGKRRAQDISRLDAAKLRRDVSDKVAEINPAFALRKRIKRQGMVLRVGDTSHLDAVEREEEQPLLGLTCFVYPSEESFQPVLNHPEIVTKQDVEVYLKKKGAKVVMSASSADSNLICIASVKSVQKGERALRSILKVQSENIFKLDFIVACCEQGRLLNEPEFSDYLLMSKETKQHMRDLDEFGDHFVQNTDVIGLERCMDQVASDLKQRTTAAGTPKKEISLEDAYDALAMDEDDPLAIDSFTCRGMFAFVPAPSVSPGDCDVKFAQALIKLQGGFCVSSMGDDRLTHVVLIPAMEDKVKEVLKEWREIGTKKEQANPPDFIKLELIVELAKEKQPITWELYPKRIEYSLQV